MAQLTTGAAVMLSPNFLKGGDTVTDFNYIMKTHETEINNFFGANTTAPVLEHAAQLDTETTSYIDSMINMYDEMVDFYETITGAVIAVYRLYDKIFSKIYDDFDRATTIAYRHGFIF